MLTSNITITAVLLLLQLPLPSLLLLCCWYTAISNAITTAPPVPSTAIAAATFTR